MPKILGEITGNTHGIKFKMNPPRNPKSRNVKIPRVGADWLGETTGVLVICQAARSSPFGCCANTTRPDMDDRFFGADSSGTRKTISLLFRDSTEGCATIASGSGNGKKSSAAYFAKVSLVIF